LRETQRLRARALMKRIATLETFRALMKRIATLETAFLRKKRSRRNLHASSLTRLQAPHPTPPRDPLPHSSHLPHNPLPPQDHSPPDCVIFSFSLIETIFTPLQSAVTSLRMVPKCKRYILNASPLLRTPGCTRYTLKVAFRLHMRTVSPQSRPRC
jgi:hypothetical protein